MSGIEYRVVWRFREAERERLRTYLTERGARRRLDLLESNGGTFEYWGDDTSDGGIAVTTWHLDYARLETRSVSDWVPA